MTETRKTWIIRTEEYDGQQKIARYGRYKKMRDTQMFWATYIELLKYKLEWHSYPNKKELTKALEKLEKEGYLIMEAV